MNVKDQVNKLIEESLSEARSVVEKGGTWEPLVHIVHSLGVQSMRAPGLHAGPVAKAKELGEINHQLDRLNGEFLITVSDVWIGEDTPDGFVAVSWDIAFSGRRKALEVEVQACCDRLVCGIQKYVRSSDGKVLFGEFEWGAPPLRADSSCEQQNAASGTDLSSDFDARVPFDSLQILQPEDERGNGAAPLTKTGGGGLQDEAPVAPSSRRQANR